MNTRSRAVLATLDGLLGSLLRFVTVGLLFALTALVAANILSRYTGWYALSWFDEVVSTLFAWFVFVGAGALWREREHFAINVLPQGLSDGRTGRAVAVLIALIGLGFALTLLWYGWAFVGRVTATTPVLGWQQAHAYACLPISGALMSMYALRDLWQALARLPLSGAPHTPTA